MVMDIRCRGREQPNWPKIGEGAALGKPKSRLVPLPIIHSISRIKKMRMVGGMGWEVVVSTRMSVCAFNRGRPDQMMASRDNHTKALSHVEKSFAVD